MVVHERVVELQNGSDWRIVADFSALMRDGALSTGGSIYDLQVYDNAVWYLRHENDALNLYRFVPGGAPGLMRSVPCSESLSGASIDLSTGLIATAAHRGVVALLPEGAEDWIDVPKDREHLMCFDVAARAGELYFSDLYSGRVCRVTEMDSDKPGIETVRVWSQLSHADIKTARTLCLHRVYALFLCLCGEAAQRGTEGPESGRGSV